MRSDQSYYTPEQFKYPNYGYGEKSIQIVIDFDFLIIHGKKYQIDAFKNGIVNLEKYKSRQKAFDSIYSILHSDIIRRREECCLKSQEDGDFKANLDDTEPEKLKSKDKENSDKDVITKEEQVQLIVNEFLGRSSIVSLIDIIINQLGFKTVMILPISLAASFDLNHNYCAFIFQNGFSFVDDFALADSHADLCFSGELSADKILQAKPETIVDDEDFAEEFSRMCVIEEKMRYSCNVCGQKDESAERMQSHISKEHTDGTFYFYDDPFSGTRMEKFEKRMKYLFNTEKCEKISKNIICVDVNRDEFYIGSLFIDYSDYIAMAIKGANTFVNLEISKDLWMNDHEWKNVRLRILKEKLLFYI